MYALSQSSVIGRLHCVQQLKHQSLNQNNSIALHIKLQSTQDIAQGQQKVNQENFKFTRKQALGVPFSGAIYGLLAQQSLAKTPRGFKEVQDSEDGYSFAYPFGWQEVQLEGIEATYKDVIEPLEQCSLIIYKTDKNDIQEYGTDEEVAYTLASKVLSPTSKEIKLENIKKNKMNGQNYLEFEFTSTAPNFIRHELAVVSVANGNIYLFQIGSNERRWKKLQDKIKIAANSFKVEKVENKVA